MAERLVPGKEVSALTYNTLFSEAKGGRQRQCKPREHSRKLLFLEVYNRCTGRKERVYKALTAWKRVVEKGSFVSCNQISGRDSITLNNFRGISRATSLLIPKFLIGFKTKAFLVWKWDLLIGFTYSDTGRVYLK